MDNSPDPNKNDADSHGVPFFDYPDVFRSLETSFLEVFKDVGARGAFILQKDLEGFEKDLANFAGVKYAIGVGNATDGLFLALKSAGVPKDSEVLFCSHTFVATAGAIHLAGAKPIPVECGEDHLMDPEALERALTLNTRAILPTQLNGRVCDMDRIEAFAKKHDLILIEDAAQALGAKFKGKTAGSFGVAAAISFYPAKTLGALGDAGAVLTNDPEINETVRKLRDHGRGSDGEVHFWGINSRMDNLQAAFLRERLKQYDKLVARRRQIATLYHELLGGIKELKLPPPPVDHSDHFDIFQNYEIEAEKRDELQAYLKSHRIGTLVQWSGKAVHQFSNLGFTQSLPYTEQLYKKLLMLPMNTALTDSQVRSVCHRIGTFYKGNE